MCRGGRKLTECPPQKAHINVLKWEEPLEAIVRSLLTGKKDVLERGKTSFRCAEAGKDN